MPSVVEALPDLLARNAREYGDNPAYADIRRTVSWAGLADRVQRLAANLPVRPGERVAFLLDDSVELIEGQFAVVQAGAVAVLFNPQSTQAELDHLLADSEPALLITDPRHVPMVAGRAAVVTGVDFEALATGPIGQLPEPLGLDDPAWLIYTSGTTGKPKAVVSTQRAALWSPVACYQAMLGLSSTDRLLWPLPMSHSFAHSLGFLGVLQAGASLRMTGRLEPAALIELMAEYEPTILAGVPATYHQLLAAGVGVQGSLRFCLTAGAASGSALRTAVASAVGAPLLDAYGSTETCGMMAAETPGESGTGTSGSPVGGVRVRVVDGELQVATPGLMLGYHGHPEATADAVVDGWYRTGDVGRVDESGRVTVTGKVGDLIIRGGENVDPVEIEEVLLALPAVQDAAVVGRAHPTVGEAPVAFVVPAVEGVSPAELLLACAERLSPGKVPEEIIFVPAIPRTGSGKPRRHVLRHTLASSGASLAGLSGLALGERTARLEAFVLEVLAGMLGAFDPLVSFADSGLTSLQATSLLSRLSTATGLSLPSTLAWDHPTPAVLAQHLAARLGPAMAVSEAADRRVDATDPIAIVGLGCRFPGGVGSPEDLWQLVSDEIDATSDFPTDRGWDVASIYDPEPGAVGKTYVRRGGFLQNAADFDPGFFGIAPREALAMDPQQRLLLEVAWEALERAGIAPGSLRDSATGVFVGLMGSDYGSQLVLPELDAHLALGTSGSVASGRISYVLGLRGPALTVDTACSSSLVTMHLAAQALRAGECSLALAGGATVMSTPRGFTAFSQQRALSPDGRCRAYSSGANGTAWAEGAGMVVLERLTDAQRNGHPVLALLCGSAVNSDGASNGLTAPSTEAQQEVIQLALSDAGLRGADVDVVEGHGTATALGDPIEARALLAAYGQDRERPLLLGSVKSNLGHTQAAAGIAGLIKAVWAMRNDVLPPTLYAEEPSPHVDWSSGAVELASTARPWPRGERRRRAGVSAFGIGGTNAHLIIEEAPTAVNNSGDTTASVAPWILSGNDIGALRASAARLAEVMRAGGTDPGYSLATERTALRQRAAVLTGNRAGMMAALESLAAGVEHPAVRVGVVQRESRPVFLFTGQGAQRVGMATEFAQRFPVFRRTYEAVCAEFAPYLEQPLADINAELLDRTDYTQPALFAFEVAMAALLESQGVRPTAVVGHSVGELAAAYVAGVWSLPDAVRLVAARGRAMAAMAPGGAMYAVRASEAQAEKAIAGLEVSIAGVNSPQSVVLSGPEAAVVEAAERCGGSYRRLRGEYAFHSAMLDPVLAEVREVAQLVTSRPPKLRVISTLTGQPESELLTDPEYWVRQAREAVRFADAVEWLAKDGTTTFAEVGPAAVLAVLTEETVDGTAVSLGTGLADGLAMLHVAGTAVDWAAVYTDLGGERRELPVYPFQRQRYWLEATPSDAPLLGPAQPAADRPEVRYPSILSTDRQPWLLDHRIGDDLVVPATVLIELALQAVGNKRLGEFVLQAPLVLTGECEVQVVVGPEGLTIWARQGAEWTQHVTVRSIEEGGAARPTAERMPGDALKVPVSYPAWAAQGYEYGPAFQRISAAWRSGEVLYAEVAVDPDEAGSYVVHPCLLDAAIHSALLVGESGGGLRVPFAFEGVRVWQRGAAAARVRLTPIGPDEVSVLLTDSAGQAIVSIDSLVTRALDGSAAGRSMYRVDWRPTNAPAATGRVFELLDLREIAAGTVPERARALLGTTLSWLQERLPADGLLVVAAGNSTEDPAAAAVWGMVGSVQAEYPGRVVLVDLPADSTGLQAAVDLGEPQITVRPQGLLVPRLIRAIPPANKPAPAASHGTALITGATGAVGRIVVEHLATGFDRVVLASRRGTLPDWAAALPMEVTAIACDVGDRAAVDRLVAGCGSELAAVFHLAGVLDDGVFAAMTNERLATVLAAKADAAWYLHEATKSLDLQAFVLFSSAVGVLGRAGQSNYAAANAFLDALARLRVAEGLPAQSLAWGLWATDDGMGSGLGTPSDGVLPISLSSGLAMLDRARELGDAVLVPLQLDIAALRPDAPAVLRELMPAEAAAARADVEWGGADEARLQGLLRVEVANSLGFPDPESVPLDREFSDLGFDSLTTLQLRGRLNALTGLNLPVTVLFEHPTLTELAANLAAAAPVRTVERVPDTFAVLYQRVLAKQGPAEAMAMRYLASAALPTFGVSERAAHALPPIELVSELVYLPSYVTLGEWMPRAFKDDFSLLPYPGFGPDPTIPEDIDALVAVLAYALPIGRPLTLVGHCAGGLVADALAAKLKADGRAPTGVVLIETDSGLGDRNEPRALALIESERRVPEGLLADAALLASGGYSRIFDGYRPAPSGVPTLLLAADPTPEMLASEPTRDWRARWSLPHDLVQIPGDHDTVLTDHAATTLAAIRTWLAAR
ncbi:SDR family NAD(P)-dependent oxidoreductase [Kribbella antibiotica]|uniref:SDR family NAD(P)-dependent oxidoreductase n=1 Tax=Kribbella antibiotica TaxID=190195 RepID=A0A4R4ZTZ1_9ACTN|nr:type I polyketide synthase [Kribbella antibiotica]TDD61614.1 SDR family NAD(P)-dependent oxidoreductase [Kribbella antibiotica]